MCSFVRKYFVGRQARKSWTNWINATFSAVALFLLGAEVMLDGLQGLLTDPKHLAAFIVARHIAVHWARNRKNEQ